MKHTVILDQMSNPDITEFVSVIYQIILAYKCIINALTDAIKWPSCPDVHILGMTEYKHGVDQQSKH